MSPFKPLADVYNSMPDHLLIKCKPYVSGSHYLIGQVPSRDSWHPPLGHLGRGHFQVQRPLCEGHSQPEAILQGLNSPPLFPCPEFTTGGGPGAHTGCPRQRAGGEVWAGLEGQMGDVGEVSTCPFSKPFLCYCKFRKVPCRMSHTKIMRTLFSNAPN